MMKQELEKTFVRYQGPFSIHIISTFAKFLLENTNATERSRKMLYKVFIELAQNLALYSAEYYQLSNSLNIGCGEVIILEGTDEYICTTINKILDEHAPILVKNCTEINAATVPELQERKRTLRKMYNMLDTGAHIGLIMIRLYSENPIDFEIMEQDGEEYFRIAAKIKKT